KVEVGCVLEGEIGRLPASQDLGNESCAAAIKGVRVHTIGHQAAGLDIKFKGEHRGKLVPGLRFLCDAERITGSTEREGFGRRFLWRYERPSRNTRLAGLALHRFVGSGHVQLQW